MTDVFVPSTIKRILAFGLDQLLVLFFYFPFFGLFWKVYFTDEQVFISLWTLLALFLIPAIYEFVFLMLFQATPGKLLFKLKVVPASNCDSELSFSHCLLRPLVERFSLFFSWAVYALMFFKYDRTHIADWIAETRVVQTTPRKKRPHLRWFIGSLLVVVYLYKGLNYSSNLFKNIDWSQKQIEIHTFFDSVEVSDFSLDEGENEEGDEAED